jgi:hypothetical protein
MVVIGFGRPIALAIPKCLQIKPNCIGSCCAGLFDSWFVEPVFAMRATCLARCVPRRDMHGRAKLGVATGCPLATSVSQLIVMDNKDLSAHPASEGTVTPGLCRDCRNAKIMRSDRDSVFYRCMLSDKSPDFVKYPRLPVLSCSGWQKGKPQ